MALRKPVNHGCYMDNHSVCSVAGEHLSAVADALCFVLWGIISATQQLIGELHRYHTACGESWTFISEHSQNAQNDGSRAQPLNSFKKHCSLP